MSGYHSLAPSRAAAVAPLPHPGFHTGNGDGGRGAAVVAHVAAAAASPSARVGRWAGHGRLFEALIGRAAPAAQPAANAQRFTGLLAAWLLLAAWPAKARPMLWPRCAVPRLAAQWPIAGYDCSLTPWLAHNRRDSLLWPALLAPHGAWLVRWMVFMGAARTFPSGRCALTSTPCPRAWTAYSASSVWPACALPFILILTSIIPLG